MAIKARKFRKKTALKPNRSKSAPVLSVEIIGKEYLHKASAFWKNIVSRIRSLKLAN